jgi:transcriptional regulator with XRE-family HTH domain
MLKAKKAHALFDHLKERFGLRNDRELAAALGLQSSGYVSRVRHGHLPVSAELMLKIHDAFGLEIREIKALAQEADGQS